MKRPNERGPVPGDGEFGDFGGFLPDAAFGVVTPAPSRRGTPPGTWAVARITGDKLVISLSGWRSVWAVKRKVSVPLSTVVRVVHDPNARANVRAKLRKRAGRTGLFRVGSYHSLEGWSFWAIGLGRNAVVIETSGFRYRFLVIEVEDPASTVELISRFAGRGPSGAPSVSSDPPSGQAPSK
ncbi:MAG: hypothetical protein ACYDGN_08650 [Acidimicrobiales bacterium]